MDKLSSNFHKKLLLPVLFLLLGFASSLGQTVTYSAGNSFHGNSNAITLSQQDIFVTFAGAGGATGLQFNGAADLASWTVKINGTSVPVTALTAAGFVIVVHFDATALNGVPFIKPGQTMTVAYSGGTGVGKVQVVPTAGGNYAPAMSDTSINNVVFSCGTEFLFYNQGDFATVDQCSPVVMNFHQFQFKVSLRFRNSSAFNLANFQTNIVWGDATNNNNSFYISDLTGAANATFIDATGFTGGNPDIVLTQRPVHNYPAANPVDCSFNASVEPFYNGVSFCPGLTQTNIFKTYDTDAANSGTLNMVYNPPGVGQTTDRVCLGTNVNMMYTDMTLLNCRAAIEPLVPNDQQRNIRIVYGSTSYAAPGNIPDIHVTLPGNLGSGTVQVTNTTTGVISPAGGYYPKSVGAADANGVITVSSPVTAATATTYMGTIFTNTPANQVLGQRFYVRIDYWDVCNPYNSLTPTNPAPVSFETYIEIITIPTPLTTSGASICYSSTNSNTANFTVGSTVGGYTAINWYNKNPLAGGAHLMSTGLATSFPSSSYTTANQGVGGTFKSSNAGGAYYSVWATQVVGASNACESVPIEVAVIQQPDISGNVPANPTGANSVCNGDGGATPDNVTYSEATAPPTKTIPITTFANTASIPLTTENLWSTNFPAGVSLSTTTGPSTIVSYNIAAQPNPSVTDNISVRLRYTSGQTVTITSPNSAPNNVPSYNVGLQTCQTNNANLSVTLYGQTAGGAVTPNVTICNDGSTTGTLTLSGQRGNILKWQRTFNAGGPTDIANTTATYSEVPPNGPGTYTYYAVVQNTSSTGPCLSQNSAVATVIVNPVPPQPTITLNPASNPGTFNICADGVQSVILQSSNVGGVGVRYDWFQGATLVQSGASNSYTISTVPQAGSYTVKVYGATPSSCASLVSAAQVVSVFPLPTAANPTGGGAVCSGNPAPDIVWSLTGTAPFNVTYTLTPGGPVSTTSPTNTFTIVAPNPGVNTTYQITSLSDAHSCVGTSLGGTASVTIGGTAPAYDTPPVLTPSATCDLGGSTVNPSVAIDLNGGVDTYTLSYKVDGGTTKTKSVTTNASGMANITFSYATDFGGTTTPSPHVLTLISFVSSFGCQTVFNTALNYTVNPTPPTATGATNSIACSTGGGQPMSVADPGAGFTVLWSTTTPAFTNAVPGSGAASGTRNKTFTPTTSATATFYAFIQSTTGPTNCTSTNGLAVTQTQDINPTNVNAGSAINTCTSSAVLAASTPVNGTGTWTGPGGVTFTNANSPTSTVNNLPVATTMLTWTVTSTLGACSAQISTVNVTRNPLPAAIDPAPALCEAVAGGGSVPGVSLTTYNDGVTGIVGSINRTIKYFSDAARTINVTAIPQTITNGKQYFTTVQDATTLCSQNGTITFLVNPLPSATNQNLSFCEDLPVGSGRHAGLDLTASNNAITGGVGNRSVAWYSDAGLTTLIPTPNNYLLVGNVTVYALVTNTLTSCKNTATVNLTTKSRPLDNPIQGNSSVCTGSSIILYQLDPSINPGSSYTWSVVGSPPADVQIFGGGGTNTANFFVLLKFPSTTGTVAIDVFETLNGCQGDTQHMTVQVNSAPAPNVIVGPTQVCVSQTTVNYQVATPNGTSTYTWSAAGATIVSSAGGSINVDFTNSTAPVQITVSETSGSGCVGAPAILNVSVNPRPTMTSSSSSNVCSGDTPTLSFTSDIASTYAWTVTSITGSILGTAVGNMGTGDLGLTFNGVNALTNVSGFVGSVTFNVVPTATAAPNCVGATEPVVLTVNPKPVFANGQAKTICSGVAVGYEILLTPANLPAGTTFSWPDPDGAGPATSGTNVPMGTAGTIHINDILTNATNSPTLTTYVITGTSGTGCITSSTVPVNITIEPKPTAVLTNSSPIICNTSAVNIAVTSPTNPTIPPNLTFDLAVTSTNPGATGGTAFSSLAGQSFPFNITGSLTNSSAAFVTVTFTVTPKLTGCANGTPQVTTVIVQPTPVAAMTNGAPSICQGGNVNIQISSTTSPSAPGTLSFDLGVASTNPGATGGTAFSNLTNQTFPLTLSGTLTNSGSNAITVTYTVTPKLSGCANGTPQSVAVVVDPTPQAVISNTTPDVCQGGNANIQITSPSVPSVPANLKFDLTVTSTNTAATGGTAFANLSNQSFPVTVNGTLTNSSNAIITLTYSVVPKYGACANGPTQTTQIVIEPTPQAVVNNTTGDICNGSPVSIAITSPSTPSIPGNLEFDVAVSSTNAGATSGSAFTALSNQTFPLTINGTLNNSSTSTVTVTYTITPKLTGCGSGPPQTTTVAIEPTPQAAIANTTPLICNGGNINLNITSPSLPTTPSDLKFDVAVTSTNPGATGGSAFTALANQTFPLPITGTLTNSSSSDITVTYKITPKLNGCPDGPIQTSTVLVEPTPQAVIANGAPDICNGGNVNLNISSPTTPSIPANLTFDVAVSSTNAGATGGTAFAALTNQTFPLTITGTLTNSSNLAVTVTYSITPKLVGCTSGTVQMASVIVEPTPTAVVTNTKPSVCDGDNLNIQLTSPTTPSVPSSLTFDVAVSSSDPANTGGSAFSALNNQSFPLTINGALTNSGNNPITVTFKVTPKLSGCASGGVQTTTVVVDPSPQAVLANGLPTVCNGGNINIGVTTPTNPSIPANLRFDVAVSSTNNAVTGGTAFAALTNQNFPTTLNGTLTNSSNSFVTVTYTITPKLVGCTNGPIQTTTVNVEPTPQAAVTNTTPDICNGGNINLQITSPTGPSVPGNLKFDVAVSSSDAPNTSGSAFATLTGQVFPLNLTGVLNNSSNSKITVTYTITPTLNGCANGPVQTTAVVVEPTPQAVITNTAPDVCNSGNVNLTISSPSVPTIPTNLKFDLAVSSSDAGSTGGGAFNNLSSQSFPLNITGSLTNSSNTNLTVTFTVTPTLSGCTTGPPQSTSVIVEPTPQAAITNTIPLVCNGGNVNIQITSPSGPSIPTNLTFDLAVSSSNPGMTGGGAFAALTSQSFPFTINGILTNASNNPITVTFMVTPKLGGCSNGPPQTTTVVIDPVPVATVNNTTPIICNNGNVSLSITSPSNPSTPANLKFAVAVSSSNPGVTGGSAFASLANQTFPLVINGNLTNSSNSTVTVSFVITPELNGCPDGTPQTTTVEVNPTPQAAITNTTADVCSGGNVNIQITSPTSPSTPANLTFDVAVSSTNGALTGGTAFAALSNQSFPLTIAGTLTNASNSSLTVTYTVTPKLNGCSSGPIQTTNVVVEPPPVAAIANTTPDVCNGDNVNITITTPTVPTIPGNLTFDVAVSSTNDAVMGGTAFAPLTGQSFPLTINGTLTNSSGSFVTLTYSVTPKLNGCANGTIQTTSVIIEPTPQAIVSNLAPTICNSGNVNIKITTLTGASIPANQKFDVAVSSTDAGSTGGSAFAALSSQSFPLIITGNLTNSSSAFVTVTFTITPTLVGCPNGPPQTANVIVEPTPQASIANTTPDVCNNGNVSINITSPTGPSVPANLKFDVAVSSSNGGVTGGTAFASLVSQSFPLLVNGTLTNSSTDAITVTYKVTPKLGGCTDGAPQTTTVIVEPTPTAAIVNNKTRVCNNDSPDISVTSPNHPSVPANLLFDVTVTSTDPAHLSGTAANNQTNVSAPFAINAVDGTLINSSTSNITVTYTVTPKLTGCTAGTPVSTTVTLEPTPAVSVVNNATAICGGASPNISITTSVTPSVPADQTFDIGVSSSNPGNTGGTAFVSQTGIALPFTLNSGTLTNSSTTDLTVTFTFTPKLNGCPSGTPVTTNVTVHPIPTVNPTSGAICSDNAANVTFTSPVAGVIFGWKVTSITGSTVTGIALNDTGTGNTVPNIIHNVTSAQAQITFTVTPTNPVGLGGCVGPTHDIVVTVDPEPVMLNPGLDKTVCSGLPTGVVFATNGTSVAAVSYRIDAFNANGLGENASNVVKTSTVLPAIVSSSQLATEKFTNLTAGTVNVTYQVTPIGPNPLSCTGVSLLVTVSVMPEPTLSPGSTTLCSDLPSGIILGPAVGSAPITSYLLKNISKPTALTAGPSNAGLGTYTTNNFLALDQFTNTTGGTLDVVYTIAPIAAGCQGADQTVTFHVGAAPALATNLDKTTCTGGTSGIVFAPATGSVPVASYNILSVVIPGGLTQTAGNTGGRNGVTATEVMGDVFTNPGNVTLTVVYNVQAVSTFPCKGPQLAINLVVEPTITATPVNNLPDICSNSPASITLASPTVPSSGPITFDYQAKAGAITVAQGSNLAAGAILQDVLTNTTNAPVTVVYTITPHAYGAKNGAGCSGAPVTVNVKVEPQPALIATPSIQSVCAGAPTAVKLTTLTVPSTGTVQFSVVSVVPSDPSMTVSTPTPPVFLNGQSITDTWSNPTFIPQTVTYTLQPVINGGLACAGTPVIVTINVTPLPVLDPITAPEVCSQTTFNIPLNATGYSNVINSWTATLISGDPGTTGFSGGTGNLIFQSIKNPGSTQAKIRYTITPRIGVCSGTPALVDVLIDPIPTITGVPTSINVCFNSTLNVPLTSPVAGTTFTWTVDPNSSGITGGSGPVITQLLNNPAGDFLTYHISATGPGTTMCPSLDKTLSVIAAPQITVVFDNPDTTWLCSGNKDFLTIELGGQPSFTFTYSVNGVVQPAVTKAGGVKTIPITPPLGTTVYKIESATDVYGCAYPGPFPQVVYIVGTENASFSIVGPTAFCGPQSVSFQYNQVAGTEYTWNFGDGADSATYIAATSVANMTIKHLYTNQSTSSTIKPKIQLRADLPAPFPGCSQSVTHQINVYPSIITEIAASPDSICSGQVVQLSNHSHGATNNRWFYRVKGTTSEEEVQTTPQVAYTLTNNTSTNPLIYEIVYQPSNANCPGPDSVIDVAVFRGVTASIDTLAIPPFLGGSTSVTFLNTSSPLDPTQFQYDWDFGLDATPATASGIGDSNSPPQFHVSYSSPGPRDITLTITNIAAAAAGLTCTSEYTISIDIKLLPLVAAFTAAPPASCFPSAIVVTSNTSTGDVMQWKLLDNGGMVAATSNAPTPTFQITSPGTYTLTLRTSSSITGQTATAPPQDFVIHDKPIASFDVRPDVVFVPDTELNTFNFSQSPSGFVNPVDYFWDFGDNDTSTDFQPTYTYKIEGKYDITLIVKNDWGDGSICSDTLVRTILAKQGGVSKVPNAFTPNPNGPTGGVPANGSFNDVFLPIVQGVEEFNMQIYDRWGNLIFESNSANIGWDGYDKAGRLLPAGVYVYKLTLRLSDSQRTTQIGDVTMIR
jgi:gliding motility-associated-like protein